MVHQSDINLGKMLLGSEHMWFLLATKLLTIMRLFAMYFR